jgi:hypothetical protein
MRAENEQLQSKLDEILAKTHPFAMQSLSPDLEQQIHDLLATELFKKDEEITHLRKLSSEYKQLS